MGKYTKDDIIRMADEQDVAFIRLQFCDIFGTPKNMAITSAQLEKALSNRCSFESSLIEGFSSDEEEVLYLHPDLDTFGIFPWRPQSGKVARLFCDIYTGDGKPYAGDSRRVLENVLKRAEQKGLFFDIRPQLEFFLFHTDDDGLATTNTHEVAGGYDVAPLDLGENVRRDIILNLEKMGFEIESSHHEASPAQHELDFSPLPAAQSADDIITFRQAVKTTAKKFGLYATFLPKPNSDTNGSGMRLGIRCMDQSGRDLFFEDPAQTGSPYAVPTALAGQFLSGVLSHIKGMTLYSNPIVNSYKRLVAGFNAPLDIFASDNRTNESAVIFMPKYATDRAAVELNTPDNVCNPYLAIALTIAAGLEGIEKGASPAEICHKNVRRLDNFSAESLPETLGQAIRYADEDPLIRETIGSFIYDNYRENKLEEWREFRRVVTSWEIERYLGEY